MNVSFKLTDESKKEEFDNAWKAAGISGLKRAQKPWRIQSKFI